MRRASRSLVRHCLGPAFLAGGGVAVCACSPRPTSSEPTGSRPVSGALAPNQSNPEATSGSTGLQEAPPPGEAPEETTSDPKVPPTGFNAPLWGGETVHVVVDVLPAPTCISLKFKSAQPSTRGRVWLRTERGSSWGRYTVEGETIVLRQASRPEWENTSIWCESTSRLAGPPGAVTIDGAQVFRTREECLANLHTAVKLSLAPVPPRAGWYITEWCWDALVLAAGLRSRPPGPNAPDIEEADPDKAEHYETSE